MSVLVAVSRWRDWVWPLTRFASRKWRSGLNRISHPDWVKFSVELNCAPNQNTRFSFSLQQWYYLTHNWGISGSMPFPKSKSELEFKLTYFETTVQHLSHYTMGTPPLTKTLFRKVSLLFNAVQSSLQFTFSWKHSMLIKKLWTYFGQSWIFCIFWIQKFVVSC